MFPTLLLPRRTYIDEFVIAAKKSRFWIDCIPKIEILAFNHVGEIIYRDRFCNIFPIFRFICAFLWFNCICFLGLCLLRVWILKKINENLTKKLKKRTCWVGEGLVTDGVGRGVGFGAGRAKKSFVVGFCVGLGFVTPESQTFTSKKSWIHWMYT